MLKKLMKHEFRATGRIMLPLYLLLIATSLGARAAVSGLLETEFALVDILASLFVVAFAVTMAAVCLVSVFLMIQRFYQNLLRDEGYVMMTLPVSVHQQVWSKLLVGVIWCAATVLAVCLALFILVFDMEILEGFFRFFGEFWAYFRTELGLNGILAVLEVLMVAVIAVCSMYLEFYCALSIGHSFANHKLIWSVAAYFGMDAALAVAGGTIMTALHAMGMPEVLPSMPHADWVLHASLWASAAVCAASAGFYYAVTTWFLKNKLDLE